MRACLVHVMRACHAAAISDCQWYFSVSLAVSSPSPPPCRAPQVLMTRAARERQAAALKRRYRAALIRVFFPDGLVLQGVFRPSEPTTALYEVSCTARHGGYHFR